MERTGNPEFLSQAENLISNGRIPQAAEKLHTFRDDSYKAAYLPARYYQMRAIVELLDGDFEEALGFISDGGGLTIELFDEYEKAYIACVQRLQFEVKPRWRFFAERSTQRNTERLNKLVQRNFRQLLALSQELPFDPYDRVSRWLGIEEPV